MQILYMGYKKKLNLLKNAQIFKTIVDNKTSYNIFIGNLHIRLEMSPNEKVYSIHLKKQEENS